MRGPRLVLLVVLFWLLPGCAGVSPTQPAPGAPEARGPLTPKDALLERATKFWEARVKGDLVTQYELLEPRARERVTLTGFVQARSSMVFRSYKIQEVEVMGDEGRVTAMSTFRMNLPQVARFGPWEQRTVMRWVKVDGLWYVEYDQQGVKEPLRGADR